MQKQNTKKYTKLILMMFIAAVVLSSCARNEVIDECLQGRTYGFFYGLIHGFLAPLEFIAMIFGDKYTIYAPNNSGAWYAFGFLLGSGGWGFMGGKSFCGRKSK